MTESEMIERAARALYDLKPFPYLDWDDLAPILHERYLDQAQAALTAINLPQMLEVVAAAREAVCVDCEDVCGESLERRGSELFATRMLVECAKGRLKLRLRALDPS